MKKIVLIGYMGSGKSTIGKLLQTKIDFEFFDLDEIITKDLGEEIKNKVNNPNSKVAFSVKRNFFFMESL